LFAADYVHLCANETIHGLEYLTDPDISQYKSTLVGDFTSTLLSRPVDISKYGIVYASGAKEKYPAVQFTLPTNRSVDQVARTWAQPE